MNVKSKRNVAILGHAHSGKTSLVESLLSAAGASSRKGDVMQGTSISDYNEDEKSRKISINNSYLNFVYKGTQIQLIDTPGYADFIGESISALHVCDAAVVVIDAFNGVEVGTEDAWQRLTENNIPRLIFINKVEKEGVNLEETLSSIKETLSPNAVVVDLESSELIEAVAESDDELLEKYLETGELTKEEVNKALRISILNAKLFPIITGSALTDQGVKELLEEIIAYLPSPDQRVPFKAFVEGNEEAEDLALSEDGPFVGFVFKSMFDPHLGHLFLMRIIRGQINTNFDCFNVDKNSKEHIGAINVLNGKEQSPVQQATCGDIVALPKLKVTAASQTLCDAKHKVRLTPIVFPEPAISASIKPKTRADEEKIATSLHRLCEEDLTFQLHRNAETKEMLISGVGDLHLKVMLARMSSRYKVEVELGKPKVSYRETITKKARHRYKYKKQSGGRGQYGDVDLEIEPFDTGAAQYEFVNKIFGGAIPRNYIPSIEKGVQATIKEGVLAGYPIYNMQITVMDGSYHDVDSSDMAFQIASSTALKEAFRQAAPILLEPIMEISIVVPGDYIGQISGDVSSRRGRIIGTESRGKKDVVKAQVPLAELFSYATDLRSMTQGRGSYTMKFDHYEHMPQKLAEQVIAQSQEEKVAA